MHVGFYSPGNYRWAWIEPLEPCEMMGLALLSVVGIRKVLLFLYGLESMLSVIFRAISG